MVLIVGCLSVVQSLFSDGPKHFAALKDRTQWTETFTEITEKPGANIPIQVRIKIRSNQDKEITSSSAS